MTVVEIEFQGTEEERVAQWRLEQLVRAGYDETAALLLADVRHIDVHAAADLLRHGCPADTALRILL